jgi:M6 family metalloprotease-like protein
MNRPMHKMIMALTLLPLVASLAAVSPVRAAQSGDLIKGLRPDVYYVTDEGTRLAFPNEATYFSWYPDWGGVKIVSDEEIAKYPLSGLATVRPGVRLVKVQSDPKVYAVARGGVLRWLSTEAIAAMIFGTDWNKLVIDIPDSFFVSYSTGTDINAGGQYWWRQESVASPTISADQALIPTSTDVGTPSTPPQGPSPADQPDPTPPITPPVTPPPETPPVTPPPETPPPPAVLTATVTPAPGPTLTRNLLALLWNPQDTDGRVVHDASAINNLLFGTGKSVVNYYAQESGGFAQINKAGLMGWFPAKKPASHYWATPDPTDADGDGYVHGHNEKWAEAILDADPDFDFAAYDVNHDGELAPSELGIVVVIPSGSPFGTNRFVWGREYPTLERLTVDGVNIGMIAEWYTDAALNFGVAAHEIGHLLYDFPDLYQNSVYRANNYSLFDASYCNCGIDPWEKAVKGWTNIAVPTQSGIYELGAVSSNHTAMKISRPGSEEFFLIENREAYTFDSPLDPGLLVWDILKPSTTGDWGRENIRLLRPNITMPSDYNASYHQRNGTPGTTGQLKWSDGSLSGVTLSEIGAAGATMRFTLTLP